MTQIGIARRALLALAVVAGAAMPATSAAQGGKDVVQVATEAGSFTTLVAAVQAAGLVETLKGEGPFTVFAPSDAAFEKLPPGTVEALLQDRAALSSILTFHVVPGRIMAADIVSAGSAKPRTVNGEMLDVQVRDGKVYVNGAQVTTADVAASNGVIHVIDSVLLPPSNR